MRARGSTSVLRAVWRSRAACSWLTAAAASPSIMRVIARRSASAIARIASASATPARSLPRQIGRLTPTMAIHPRPSAIVYAGPVRIVAIGRNMPRITWTSASARAISARPAASSGRDVAAVFSAGHDGTGCVRTGSASCGTGSSASRARLVFSIASAPRTSPISARAMASRRATSTSARSTSDCSAVPLAYRALAALTTSRAKAICSLMRAAVRRRSWSIR